MWCGSRPASSVRCTVRPALKVMASKTCRTIDPVKWPPMRWNSNPAGSPECTRYGRPEMSTTACASDSSSGTSASPKRAMPRLSPSACLIAVPSTMPVSSTVWCTSIWVSPSARTVRSTSACLAKAVSMWSKNGTVVWMSLVPVPSRSRVSSMLDSLVCRLRRAVRWVLMGSSLVSPAGPELGQAAQEELGLGGGAGRHTQGVRDADVADEDVALEQRAEGGTRVVDPVEEHEVRLARPRAVPEGREFGDDVVALRHDVVDHREHLGRVF